MLLYQMVEDGDTKHQMFNLSLGLFFSLCLDLIFLRLKFTVAEDFFKENLGDPRVAIFVNCTTHWLSVIPSTDNV